MLDRIKPHLTYSNVVSTLCLFAILGGGAYAADKITSKDLAKDSVRSKAIENGQVKTKDLKANAVKGEQLADGSVAAADLAAGSVGSAALTDGGVGPADLAPDEAPHIIGASGEPAYGNGVEGDCLWDDATALGTGLERANFYEDSHGRVFLSGIVSATGVPAAGDGECGLSGNDAEDDEDSRVFTLPAAYRPEQSVFLPDVSSSNTGLSAFIVAGQDGLIMGSQLLAPGTVYALAEGDSFHVLSGSWRAADATGRSARSGPDEIAPRLLKQLSGD